MEFEVSDHHEFRFVRCYVINPPIRNTVLCYLGVRREAATIRARFQIREQGTEKLIVASGIPVLHTLGGAKSSILTVTPSDHQNVWFTIAYMNTDDGSAMEVCDEFPDEEKRHPLEPGEYRVDVLLDASGKTVSVAQDFVIDENQQTLTLN